MITDPLFVALRREIFERAAALRLPTVGNNLAYAEAGALLTHAYDTAEVVRGTGRYVAAILGGADPGELPIAQPTTFRFVVNLRTARAIGVTLPAALLAQADEVIE